MTERDIFLTALDQPDPAARVEYVLKACGADTALRDKVQALLRSHETAGSFLGTPAVGPPPDPDRAVTEAFDRTPADAPRDRPPAAPADDEEEEPLTFLAPPGRPDSLGRVGHYEVLQVLGRGGFGIVFRAFDDVLQRVVAVKVLSPRMAATSPARKRFLREARAAAQVRHENVVQVYEVGEHPLPYLVMEFIPGETLQQRLTRTGPVDPLEAVRTGRQVAEGLAAAHATDLIHRDVKPGNILIEGGGLKVKLTDFGLARAADDASQTQSGVLAGTPMYMAPEQAAGLSIDRRADLFSLGSVLYQMVTGRPPFRSSTTLGVLKRVVDRQPRPIREVIPETPGWLCDIIARLHQKDPAARFQSAREVADLLAEWEQRLKANTSSTAIPVPPPAPARGGPPRWAVAAVAVGLILAGVCGYVLTRPDATGGPPAASHPLAPPGPPAADPEADRRAALYVLSVGGEVRVNGGDETLTAADRLPPEPFTLTWAYLRDKAGVTDAGMATFRGCRHVRHLDLVGTNVTDTGLAHLKDCRGLTHLDLFHVRVGDIGLSHFHGCRGMVRLNLRSTNVTDAGVAPFADCGGLELLGLGHTRVTPAGLAGFRNCKTLKDLDLDVLPVGDADVAPFAECQNLEILNLGATQVTDQGLVRFKGCKKLKTLYLRGSKVTAAGVNEIRAAVPGCWIEWNGGVIDPNVRPFGDADAARIAALPAAEQVEAVRAELKRRNPEFDGVLRPTVEDGAVTRLELAGAAVSDLGPLRALPRLTELSCKAEGAVSGRLADLSPLKGLRLVKLNLSVSQVTDLSPLTGMPLTDLHVDNSPVADLSPLRGMPLRVLNVSYTKVSDLSPLKGAPLFILWTNHTAVSDLSPLAGMRLEWLTYQGTKVTDPGVLKGMPLDQVYLDYVPGRDRELLRSIPTLRQVNDRPAAEFLDAEGKP